MPLLSDPLWLGVVAPEMIQFFGQIELFFYLNRVQINDLSKTEFFEREIFDRLTVCKEMTDV